MIPERFQWLLALNPLSALIEVFRYVVVPNRSVDWNSLGISAAITECFSSRVWAYFKGTEKAIGGPV